MIKPIDNFEKNEKKKLIKNPLNLLQNIPYEGILRIRKCIQFFFIHIQNENSTNEDNKYIRNDRHQG